MRKLARVFLVLIISIFLLSPPAYKQYQGYGTFTSNYSAIRITPPFWLNPALNNELDLTIDKYIKMYEARMNRQVRKEGLWIVIVPGESFDFPFGFQKMKLYGLFKVDLIKKINFTIGDTIVHTTQPIERERIIYLAWRFEDKMPRTLNPLHSFMHELVHDSQWEMGRPINHDFTELEKEISTDKYTKYIMFNDRNEICQND